MIEITIGKRTKDWIKIKTFEDDDFVICGYINKADGLVSLILGQYDGEQLIYKGHITMGVSKSDLKRSRRCHQRPLHLCRIPKATETNKLFGYRLSWSAG